MEPVCTAAPCIRNREGTASPIQSPLSLSCDGEGPANLIHFPLAVSLSLSTSSAEPDLIPRYYGDSNRRSTGKLRMHDINVDSHSADADSDSDCDCDVGRIRFRSNGHITFVHLQSSKWHYQFSLQELQVDPYTSTYTHAHTYRQTYMRVWLRS